MWLSPTPYTVESFGMFELLGIHLFADTKQKGSGQIIVHKVFSCSCVCSVFFVCTLSVNYEPDGSSSL